MRFFDDEWMQAEALINSQHAMMKEVKHSEIIQAPPVPFTMGTTP